MKRSPSSRSPVLSLAWRILYGSLLVVGAPLFVHTLYLYHAEYEENIRDTLLSLKCLTDTRTFYVEEQVRQQQNLLQVVGESLPADLAARDPFLKEEAKKYQWSELLYVNIQECQDKQLCLCAKQALQERTTFCDGYLYVGRALPIGLLLVRTPIKQLFEKLIHVGEQPYPIELSLVDAQGTILFGTGCCMTGRSVARSTEYVQWTPHASITNAWSFQIDQEGHLAVKMPIEGTKYSIMLDVPQRSVQELQVRGYLMRILTFFLFILVIGGCLVTWLTRRMARPLHALAATMHQISKGDLEARFAPDRMGFEINDLGLQMNEMVQDLIAHQQEAQKERVERAKLAQELHIGHEIQRSMLPVTIPKIASVEIGVGYFPAKEVSGDFYDLLVLPNGRLLMVIADAADKGISACLFSYSLRSALRSAAVTMDGDLSEILPVINQLLLLDAGSSGFFITAWVGIYHPKSRELRYANLGHLPPYLCRAEEAISLGEQGMAFGVDEAIVFQLEKVSLQEGDRLVLYTDGVLDAKNMVGQHFGKKRFHAVLTKNEEMGSQSLVDEVLSEIRRFCGAEMLHDDLTLVVVKLL